MFDAPYQWVKSQTVRFFLIFFFFYTKLVPVTSHLILTILMQANGTATPCIAVDLLETLRTQSGPYDASKTIDEQDILHITGVLYAGRVLR